jgi:hypothetical protein
MHVKPLAHHSGFRFVLCEWRSMERATGDFQGGVMAYALRSTLDLFEEFELEADEDGANVMIAHVIVTNPKPIMVPMFTFKTKMKLMTITEHIYKVYPESLFAVFPAEKDEHWPMHTRREASRSAGSDGPGGTAHGKTRRGKGSRSASASAKAKAKAKASCKTSGDGTVVGN